MKPQTIEAQPTHIAARHSTDVLAIEDPQVVAAIRYIRQNPKKLIQVGDVVEVTTLSRRSLERRFKTFLGRSVLDEIRHVHLQQITQMLTETHMSFDQIGYAMGYSHVSNLRAYFKKIKGMSPREYRKRYGIG